MQRSNNPASRGFGLIEVLIALGMIMVVTLSLAQLLSVASNSGTIDQFRVEAINLARAKLEEVEAIDYDQIGILPLSTGSADGAGYFESDPLYNPTFGQGDFLLSDQVELSLDQVATRSVKVEAVDHSGDATGDQDWDAVKDPNTGTILDFKKITVTVSTLNPISGDVFSRTLSTIVRGVLDEEVDGADGEEPSLEEDGTPDKKGKKKKAKKKKDKELTESDDHVEPKKGKKKKARKKKVKETDS